MANQLWVVIGGIGKGKKDGVLVREGADTSSPETTERLSSLAVVEEVEVQGGRLRYKKRFGSGPAAGWVSLSINGKDLLAKAEDIWEVSGGKDSGGIIAREACDTSSAALPDRLGFGALVRQLEVQGERLQYEKLTGAGPSSGWVGLKLKGRSLLLSFAEIDTSRWSAPLASPEAVTTKVAGGTGGEPGLPHGTRGDALEIRMTNEEKGFSYEGLPHWVPEAAAVKRLHREGRPYLPSQQPLLERVSLTKPLGAFKRISPKKLKELLPQVLPGDLFGLPIPRSAEQMASQEFGADWFTKAFHAAGTLPKDNKVTRVTTKELPCTGFSKEGGAAMKAFVTVEYLKQDPALHTELFAKYTWDFWRGISGIGQTLGADDSMEVLVNCSVNHLLPVRTPQFYFADVCRENTAYVIITEAIPYSKRDGQEKKPYEVLPGLGKCQDHLLSNPADFYFCLFRAMGQMGAWDHLGCFDAMFGKITTWNEEQYLQHTPHPQQSKSTAEATKTVVGQTVDKTIDFILNWCPKIACKELLNAAALQKVKQELVDMSPFFGDMSNFYQANNSNYMALNHVNLQADNAWFWRDEYGELSCGALDMGGFGRSPFAARFAGCVTGADAELLIAHLEGMVQCYVDEYRRCGGPKVSVKEVILRFHLCYITTLYDLQRVVADHVFKETPKEEYLTFTGKLDEKFQERFYTRCGTLPALNVWEYYVKMGNLKATFDEWAQGVGKQYLTVYA